MLDYAIENPSEITEQLSKELMARFPDYQFFINIDRDFSE
jgi:hypothetical protein